MPNLGFVMRIHEQNELSANSKQTPIWNQINPQVIEFGTTTKHMYSRYLIIIDHKKYMVFAQLFWCVLNEQCFLFAGDLWQINQCLFVEVISYAPLTFFNSNIFWIMFTTTSWLRQGPRHQLISLHCVALLLFKWSTAADEFELCLLDAFN